MKAGIIKHILVIFFILSIIGKEGATVLPIFINNSKEVKEYVTETEEEDSSARTESKEAELKEYWIVQTEWNFQEPALYIGKITFAAEKRNNHLAYFPSVPTPPPNPAV